MRIGIYPGTFDPVTLGHLDIIKKAAKITDKLIIGVANNSSKSTYFDAGVRARFIQKSLKDFSIKIEVLIFNGLLINFVAEHGSNLIIRGLRAVSDFEYELQMSWINHKLNSEIQTIFLPASKDNQFVSSSFVRQVAKLGGDISKFVPLEIMDEVKFAMVND